MAGVIPQTDGSTCCAAPCAPVAHGPAACGGVLPGDLMAQRWCHPLDLQARARRTPTINEAESAVSPSVRDRQYADEATLEWSCSATPRSRRKSQPPAAAMSSQQRSSSTQCGAPPGVSLPTNQNAGSTRDKHYRKAEEEANCQRQ